MPVSYPYPGPNGNWWDIWGCSHSQQERTAYLGYLIQHGFVVETMSPTNLDTQYAAFTSYWTTSTGSPFPAPLPPGLR